MLKRLVEHLQHKGGSRHQVVSLTNVGEVGQYLKSVGIQVHVLEMKSLLNLPSALVRLIFMIRNIKPNVVQTWMYHADLIGGIASFLAGFNNIIWNVRNTEIPQRAFSRTGLVIRLCALLSRFIPQKIICCAYSAMKSHKKLGYDPKRMIVIPNGFDIQKWSMPTLNKSIIRETFRLPLDTFIIGIVGRYDPLKGYDQFIKAASIMAKRYDQPLLFLMVGRNVDKNNTDLLALIESEGGCANFKLMGERSDIPQIMCALDLYCLSSIAEGFPNVVAEAMLMEIPCVVTDVGDARQIVGNLGQVVASYNPQKLANALLRMTLLESHDRKDIGRKSRKRILKYYDIDVVAGQYMKLYGK